MNRQLFERITTSQDNGSTLIQSLINTQKPVTVGFLNQHGANLCHDNAVVQQHFEALDILLRDGLGVKIAMKRLGLAPGDNLNGTDFIPALAKQSISRPLNVIVFGTKEPWLSAGIKELGLEGHCLCAETGFYDEQHYLDLFETSIKPDKLNLVLLAMGMPKQEQLALRLRALSSSPTIIVCGGAILDFQAGRFTRAPAVMRRFGLEWAYRLFKEPKRLFKRYIIGIPLFLKHTIFIGK